VETGALAWLVRERVKLLSVKQEIYINLVGLAKGNLSSF